MRSVILPFKWAIRIYRRIICFFREISLNAQVDERASKRCGFRLDGPYAKLLITKAQGAKIIINGRVEVNRWFYGEGISCISMGENSRLEIDGDFVIGNGVRISLCRDARLYIGGKRQESASGITENTKIMVRKNISIGTDFMCAWNVFITDCDWHPIDNLPSQADVQIGNHVWVAPNCSILKGTAIGDGSIIATATLLHKADIPAESLCGGNPFKILSRGKKWSRDLPPV